MPCVTLAPVEACDGIGICNHALFNRERIDIVDPDRCRAGISDTKECKRPGFQRIVSSPVGSVNA